MKTDIKEEQGFMEEEFDTVAWEPIVEITTPNPKKRKYKDGGVRKTPKMSIKDLKKTNFLSRISSLLKRYQREEYVDSNGIIKDLKPTDPLLPQSTSMYLFEKQDLEREARHSVSSPMLCGIRPPPLKTITLLNIFKYTYDNFPLRNDKKGKDFFYAMDTILKAGGCNYEHIYNSLVVYYYAYNYCQYRNITDQDLPQFTDICLSPTFMDDIFLFEIEGGILSSYNKKTSINCLYDNKLLFEGLVHRILSEPGNIFPKKDAVISNQALVDLLYTTCMRKYSDVVFNSEIFHPWGDENSMAVRSLLSLSVFIYNLLTFACFHLRLEVSAVPPPE